MSLNLQTKQNQTMSQRMIQSVRILQMTSQELDSYITDLALENPVMDVERPADESIDAYRQSYFAREQSSYLLENLDGRGYLTEDAAFVAEQYDVETEDVERLIRHLQALEPVGVCARNLGECLRLQLKACGQLADALELILSECLELVAKNKYAAISGKLGISAGKAARYGALIRSLDPKPGSIVQ